MRTAGVLLHISSLPNKYGIGSLGKEAYKFIDFLKKSGQKIWQILPIGPTSYGDSPYASLSAFAGNPYFIDLDMLVEDELLTKEDLPLETDNVRVDYANLYYNRFNVLNVAYKNRSVVIDAFEEFKEEEKEWLDDYALFMVLKGFHNGKPWLEWYDDFKYKNPDSLKWATNEYKEYIDQFKFYQFLFFKQWKKLRAYANKNGIEIMGDMPIYCAMDSSDIWANPSNFQMTPDLRPTFVAGCPPDAFSADGQLWGNPLYNYDKMKEDKYSWWVKRVKHSLRLFDILRIDHFRGFAGYYSIPYGDNTARNGHWVPGPAYDLFKVIGKAVPGAKIVAENLGFLTDDVHELLKKCKYPGMNIFQFELGDGVNVPLKKAYKENNIFYSGTHDNQTIMSFYYELNDANRKLIDKLCGITYNDKPNQKIIEFCMNTKCNMVIIPLQDYLGLTDEYGRVNTPSTVSTMNWSYRARALDLSKELSNYMLDLTVKYNR